MAITVGSVTTANPSLSWGGSDFVGTVAHTLASGSTQLVAVITGAQGARTAFWNGNAMTSRIKQLDGDQGAVDILDIDTPDIGTYNFTIRSAADFTGISIILFGLSGVNSGTPRRTPIGDTNYGGTASATATTESGDFVLGAFSTVNSATLDGSLTSLYGNLLGLNEYGSAGYLTASGATATVQATQTANQWAAAALPYIPAGGGSIVPQAMAGYRQQ